MTAIIVGIDPGYASGAIGIIGGATDAVHDMPLIHGEGVNVHALAAILAEAGAHHAFIERVSSMPGQGVSTTFKFGFGFGQIRAALALSGIPYTLVTPAKWKGHFRLSRDKDASRGRAMQLFPALAAALARKKDADRAEALLIAAYGSQALGLTPAEMEAI